MAGDSIDSLEVKNHIYDQLYSNNHAVAFQAMLDSLRADAVVEIMGTTPIGSQTIPGME